jgi:hypothetical protein
MAWLPLQPVDLRPRDGFTHVHSAARLQARIEFDGIFFETQNDRRAKEKAADFISTRKTRAV